MRVTTLNRVYTLEARDDGRWWLSGHPEYCPIPTPVQVVALTEGRGAWFRYDPPDPLHRPYIHTSVVRSIEASEEELMVLPASMEADPWG